jgi:Fe2+ or Zn2+ uptake regulation protein
MNELLKQRMIELFMTRKISASLIFKYISTEFKDITKKEFYNTLEKLTQTKEIIRRKSLYNIKCKCCNEYKPNKEMTGIYCEKCSFLGLVVSTYKRNKKYDRDEFDEMY